MSGARFAVKRRVWIGLSAALAVTGVWSWKTFVLPTNPVVAAPARAPFVRLAGAGNGVVDRLLRERADLFDPTPLFFPTKWNYGQQPLPERMRHQPGKVFESFPANFTFGEQAMKAYGSEAEVAPENLADILTQGNETPFAGMGQQDRPHPALAPRSGFLEVIDLSTGKLVIKQSLVNISIPRADFAPLEFLVAVSSSGIIGDPLLMTESGIDDADEDVDSFFRNYLVNSFRLGERLMPGRYRVSVGP
jgi:hypothetical protein